MISLRDAVKGVLVETDAELLGSFGEGHEGIPGGYAIGRTRAEADIPFAHPLPHAEFGRVVVQGQVGIVQDQEQMLFFGPGLGNALVQLVIAGLGAEERIEAGAQLVRQGRRRRLSVALELMVVVPELFLEVGQKLLMMVHEGGQFLVVTTFMDPTERLLPSNVTKLRGIIGKQDGNDRDLALGVIGGKGGCFEDATSLLAIQAWRQFAFDPLHELFRQEQLVLRPLPHQPLRPQGGLKEVQPALSLLVEEQLQGLCALQQMDQREPVFVGPGEVGGVVGVAQDVTMLVLPIDAGGGVVHVLPVAAGQTGSPDGLLLGVPAILRFDQQIRDLPAGDGNAKLGEEL
jgi:hypothetical protein